MKKIFIALLAIIMVVCCFTLVACNNKAEDIINSYIFEQESLIVDSDFVLPLTIGGEKAKWESNSELVSLEKREEDWLAKVSYPESGIQDVIITLTIGKVSKEYGVRVKAVDEYTFMENYVFLQDRGTVAKDFKLDNQYTYKNKYTCNITWSVDKDYADYLEIENYQDNGVNLQKAIVHKQSEPTPVVIKATFDYKGKQASREYSMNVYQSLEGYELVDYWYSNTGVSIDMSGYVVLIGTEYSSTYNNVTLYMVNDDYTAGYYLYRVKTTNEHAANLKVGAHVTVTGTTNTNYNGLIETNQGGNLVVDTDKHDPYDASKAVKAVDEEVIGDLPATIYNESRLVSLTGWMVKSHCSSSDLSSDNFTLMTITKGNVDVAIRMSKYLEGAYTKGDDTHKALLALLDKYIVGSTINVEGIFSCYKGAWQIMPLSAEKVTSGVVEGDVVIEAPEHKGTADDPYSVEDLEKLQAAQEALENSKNKQYVGQKVAKAVKDVEAKIKDLGLNSRITEKKELELIAESGDVKISYSIREPKSVTVEGTKLTINPSNPETTILQVNYKLGEFETVQLFYIKTLEPSAKSMLDELVVPEQLLKETALPKVEGATIEWTVGELNAEALTIDKENNQFVPHADKELNKAVIVTAKLTYKKSENEIQEASKNFVITVLQEIILEHKGTKEDPYSISDVLKLIKIGDQVTSAFYIKGYVVNVGEWKSSYGNYQDGYMADSALKEGEELEDIDSAYVYILAGIDKGRLCVGDEITASVESLKYYNGVWELYKATATQRKPVAESGEKDNPYAPSEIVKLESHKSLKDKYVSGYIVELGRYSDTYGVYNYARIADSMSSTDKLYVSFIKGNGEGKLNVGDQILGIASSIDYIGEAWELNTINVVERTAVEIKEEVDTNTYVKGIVVELGDWSDANGYAYVLIADAVDGKVKASIANFKGINDGKLVVKDVLVCSFEKIEKDSQLQLTGVKVVTVNGKEQDENYVPDVDPTPAEENVYIKTNDGKYLTTTEKEYTSSSGSKKIELVITDDKSEAVQLTKRIDSNGNVTFVTSEGKYLYTNGTDVKFVAEEGDYTLFVLEPVSGGYNIKSAKAEYNGNAQYLETYSGYVTVYGKANASDLSVFVYSFEIIEGGSQGGETGGDQGGSEVNPEPTLPEGNIIFVNVNGEKTNYVTGTDEVYNNTKHQLKVSSEKSDAISLTIRKNNDGTVTFVTADNKYLLSDGTHVQLVDSEGDNTLFVIESSTNGYYIKCKNATYNGNAQYLRVKYNVLSVFSFNEDDLAVYVFSFEVAESGSQGGETGGETGGDEGSESKELVYSDGTNKVILYVDYNRLDYFVGSVKEEAHSYSLSEGVYTFTYAGGRTVTFSIEGKVLSLTDSDLGKYELTLVEGSDNKEEEKLNKGELLGTITVEAYSSGQEWKASFGGDVIFDLVISDDCVIEIYDADAFVSWGNPFAQLSKSGKVTLVSGETYYFCNLDDKDVTISVYSILDDDGNEKDDGKVSIAEALKLEDGANVVVSGTVCQIKYAWSDETSNMSVYIKDSAGNKIQCFKLATKVALYDEITVTGKMTTYYEEREIAEGCTAVIDKVHVCEYADADCLNPAKCPVCGAVKEGSEALGHIDENNDGLCDRCKLNISSSSVSFSCPKLEKSANMSGDNQASSLFNLDDSIFNISAAKTGSNYVGLNKDGTMRLYKNESTTLNISIADNYKIVSIKVNLAETTPSTNLKVMVGDTIIKGNEGVYEVNGSSVVLSNIDTDNQIYVQSIEIVYSTK